MNCPFCGGRNTFTITRHGGRLVWNCYRASCDAKGIRDGEDSVEGVRQRLAGDGNPSSNPLPPIPFLTRIENQPLALKWLDKVHALRAYKLGLLPIRFAPSEDRIMFPIIANGSAVGYTGRARAGVRPKWRNYGDTSHGLTVGKGDTAVVVEDAASACAVGVLPEYTGVALLGTNLTDIHKHRLLTYSNVIVALDPDAAAKSLEIAAKLSGVTNATSRLLEDDLKYYDIDDIRSILSA